MKTYRMTLAPKTAFGTPLLGETLFGCLCWAIRRRSGNDRLTQLLSGYTRGNPFAVISDAFPSGYIPLPALPTHFWAQSSEDNRKYLKKKIWVGIDALAVLVCEWRNLAKTDSEVAQAALGRSSDVNLELTTKITTIHNTINRETCTTGTGMFAPFKQQQIWFNPSLTLDVYIVIDETRLSAEEVVSLLKDIGMTGFGRDASVGMGKFEVVGSPVPVKERRSSESVLALASVDLSGLPDVVSERTFYRVKTHFGRHGAELAVLGMPFKKPVLLAQAGAVITWKSPQAGEFIGRGITGTSVLLEKTVHQGYCPVFSIPDIRKEEV